MDTLSLDYKPPNISPFRHKWVAQRKAEVDGKNVTENSYASAKPRLNDFGLGFL